CLVGRISATEKADAIGPYREDHLRRRQAGLPAQSCDPARLPIRRVARQTVASGRVADKSLVALVTPYGGASAVEWPTFAMNADVTTLPFSPARQPQRPTTGTCRTAGVYASHSSVVK